MQHKRRYGYLPLILAYPQVAKKEKFFQLPILVDNEVFPRDASKQSLAKGTISISQSQYMNLC